MSAGKGDKPRPVDKEKYDRNFERIFAKDMTRLSDKIMPKSPTINDLLKADEKARIRFKAMIQSPEGEVAEENDLGSHIEYIYENGAKIVIEKTVIEKWEKNKK